MTLQKIIREIRKEFLINRLEHLERLRDRGLIVPNEDRLSKLIGKNMNLKLSTADHLLRAIGFKLQVVPLDYTPSSEEDITFFDLTQNGFHYEDDREDC